MSRDTASRAADFLCGTWADRVRAAQGEASPAPAAEVEIEPHVEPSTEIPRVEILRSRRQRGTRAHTVNPSRGTKRELAQIAAEVPEQPGVDYRRPRTRSECADGERPCPFVSCQHHLYLDVTPATGALQVHFPDLEVWELTATCALDVADQDGATLEDVGAILNVTRERVRQLEARALEKVKRADARLGKALEDLADTGRATKHRSPVTESAEADDEDLDDDELAGEQPGDVAGDDDQEEQGDAAAE